MEEDFWQPLKTFWQAVQSLSMGKLGMAQRVGWGAEPLT